MPAGTPNLLKASYMNQTNTVAVRTDYGEQWRGPVSEFLAENDFDAIDVAAFWQAIESDEIFYIGGGAAPLTWVERID